MPGWDHIHFCTFNDKICAWKIPQSTWLEALSWFHQVYFCSNFHSISWRKWWIPILKQEEVLHFVITHAWDVLSIDIQVIVMKFFVYFGIYIVGIGQLKDLFWFCCHLVFFSLPTFKKPIGSLLQMQLSGSSVYLKH